MAKTISITYKGTEYTLEFTRKSVETMERQGFVIGDIGDKPISTLPALFAGAFLAHHRSVENGTVEKIFAGIPDKTKFIQKLAEMYNEPLETLLDEPEETEGNLTWGANW